MRRKQKLKRIRNDSGYCDLEDNTTNDKLGQTWDDMIRDWSVKAQSIVSQEVDQMTGVTKVRKAGIAGSVDEKEKDMVVRKWKQDLAAMMQTTNDLLQCLTNDFLEQIERNDSETKDTHSSSKALGRILEEKLQERRKKIYVVRTKTREAEKLQKNYRNFSKTSDEIIMNGNVWKPNNSLTIQVDELERNENKRALKNPGMESLWDNFKDQSPVVWEEDEAICSDEDSQLEVEDIFHDWMKINLKEKPTCNDDINLIFWKISLEDGEKSRQRRMSDILDNLPFQDQPDIFQDPCDILDRKQQNITGKNQKRMMIRQRSKKQKCYWNIFDEWKHNLEENGKRRRYMKRRIIFQAEKKSRHLQKKRHNTPPKKGPFSMRIFGKQSHNWYHHPNKYLALSDESTSNGSGRRRSREEFEADDEDALVEEGHQAKRLKHNTLDNWEAIQYESNKSFELLTKNIEQKIREAFREESYAELKCLVVTDEDEDNYEEDDGIWPLKAKKILKKSRAEFITLRDEVRRMRKCRRKEYRKMDDLELFQDWNWNLIDVSNLEYDDIFDDWKFNLTLAEPLEDVFSEWNWNLIENLQEKRRASFHNYLPTRKIRKSLVESPLKNKSLNLLQRNSLKSLQNGMKVKQSCAMKFHRQLMKKCYPNQPRQRGIV